MIKKQIVLAALAMVTAGCGLDDSPNAKIMASSYEQVFVMVDPGASMLSMMAARQAGSGPVTTSNSKIVHAAMQRDDGKKFHVVLTDEALVPAGSFYMAVRVWQAYEEAVNDSEAAGIVVNPGQVGSVVLARKDINKVLPIIPRPERIPVAVKKR